MVFVIFLFSIFDHDRFMNITVGRIGVVLCVWD